MLVILCKYDACIKNNNNNNSDNSNSDNNKCRS